MQIERVKILLVVDQPGGGASLSDTLTRLGYDIYGVRMVGAALSPHDQHDALVVIVAFDASNSDLAFKTACQIRLEHEIAVVVVCHGEPQVGCDEVNQIGYLASPFEDRDLHATIQLTYHCCKGQRAKPSPPNELEAPFFQRIAKLEPLKDRPRPEYGIQPVVERGSQTSDDRLLLALLASNQGLWDWNLISNTIFLCRKSLAITGLTQDEIDFDYEFLRKVVHAEDVDDVIDAIERHVRGETEFISNDFRVVTDTTMGRWVRCVGRVAERDEHGAPRRILGSVSDIHSQKQMELQLSQFRQAIESANSGIFLVDAQVEGKPITYVNSAFSQMTGYSREEVLGQHYRTFSCPQANHSEFAALCKAFADRQPCQVVLKNHRKDGTALWNQLSIAPITDDRGRVTHFVGVLNDITARKQAESRIKKDISLRKRAVKILRRSNEELEMLVRDRTAKLQESEERLRIFVENVPAGVAMFDRDMRILAYSNRWQADYRLEGQELIGRSYYELLPQIPERIRKVHQHCLEGHSERADQDAVELDHGEIEYFRWEVQPWRNSLGIVGGLVIFTELITKEVLARQALIESEERFEQIATSINHIFWVCVLPDLKYLYVSPAFEMIFGRPIEDIYARPMCWLENVHEDDRRRVRRAFSEWIENPTEATMSFRVVRGDGECRWLYIRGISVRREQGGRYRVTGVTEDVTDAKLMEMQALKAQKLQAVGQLAGGIAHDFNNFLLLISCCSEQLLEQFPNDDSNRQAATAIRDAVERAKGLTRQLLAFTRKQVLDLTVGDLNQLVSKSIQMMKQAIRDNITLNIHLTSQSAMIKVDPGQIDQILLNLILNAQDAMPNGGTVTIETNRYDLGTRLPEFVDDHTPLEVEVAPGRYVGLKVIDTGTGMSENVKARIFEPYFSTKQGGKGAGLGLAVVQGIVSQYGGYVKVDSKLGMGTQFEIFLPYAETDDTALPQSLNFPDEFDGTETILLVEDGSEVRPILKRALESHGYYVLEAPHGPAALALAIRYSGPIDLLLTDVVMPEMNGVEVSEALAAIFPDLATIFISGYANNESIWDRVRRGDNCFLQKPFGTNEMLRKVREVLDQRSVTEEDSDL